MINTINKKCKDCGKLKKIYEFYIRKESIDGYRNECKECHRKYKKLYYLNNKTKLNEKNRKYYNEHKIEIENYRNGINFRYSQYKFNAKKEKRLFAITIEQFEELTSKKCYYCGKYSEGKEYCGIDRVDSNLNYSIDNCVSCCFLCNGMKSNKTKEQFINHIIDIANFQSKK